MKDFLRIKELQERGYDEPGLPMAGREANLKPRAHVDQTAQVFSTYNSLPIGAESFFITNTQSVTYEVVDQPEGNSTTRATWSLKLSGKQGYFGVLLGIRISSPTYLSLNLDGSWTWLKDWHLRGSLSAALKRNGSAVPNIFGNDPSGVPNYTPINFGEVWDIETVFTDADQLELLVKTTSAWLSATPHIPNHQLTATFIGHYLPSRSVPAMMQRGHSMPVVRIHGGKP